MRKQCSCLGGAQTLGQGYPVGSGVPIGSPMPPGSMPWMTAYGPCPAGYELLWGPPHPNAQYGDYPPNGDWYCAPLPTGMTPYVPAPPPPIPTAVQPAPAPTAPAPAPLPTVPRDAVNPYAPPGPAPITSTGSDPVDFGGPAPVDGDAAAPATKTPWGLILAAAAALVAGQ